MTLPPSLPLALSLVLIGVAAVLLAPAEPRPRASVSARPGRASTERGGLARFRLLLAALSGAGVWLVFGGVPGVVLAVAATVVAYRVLGAAESPSVRRRREALERDLPVGVTLFAASLEAGADVASALVAVGDALPGPVGEEFGDVARALRLGSTSEAAWASVVDQPLLRRLGTAVVRSQESGASVAGGVRRLAEDLDAERRARTEALARRVGVQAALPLGVCFLPAFVLLGVVPMAVGLFRAMHLFG